MGVGFGRRPFASRSRCATVCYNALCVLRTFAGLEVPTKRCGNCKRRMLRFAAIHAVVAQGLPHATTEIHLPCNRKRGRYLHELTKRASPL